MSNTAPPDSLASALIVGDLLERLDRLDVDALRIWAVRLQDAEDLCREIIRAKLRKQRRERKEAAHA
jgi:hypothetical protein